MTKKQRALAAAAERVRDLAKAYRERQDALAMAQGFRHILRDQTPRKVAVIERAIWAMEPYPREQEILRNRDRATG